MNQPAHKRPRKAVMRLAMLDGNITGRSNVLLGRARSYLNGDEVFEELYAHAVDLEKKVEDDDQVATINEVREKLNDFREAVDGVYDDLERKQKERDALVTRFRNVLDDEAIPKLEAAIATVAERAIERGVDDDGSLEASMRVVLDHLKALSADIDDIPTIEEEIGTLKSAWEDAGE